MPKDFICKPCGYTISVGWYHYHEFKEGYGARTKFACGQCGICHYVEHADRTSSIPDRYLYLRERSGLSEKHPASQPPGPAEVSSDLFTSFDSFVCPVCQSRGKVITEQAVKEHLPACPLCKEEMALLTEWTS